VTGPALFAEPLRVVNVGLEVLADALATAGVPVVRVAWRPPAGGDARLVAWLVALEDEIEDEIETAGP
jgi:FdrA protein